jgi:hypothetical protein
MQNSKRTYTYAGHKELADTRTGEIEKSVILKQVRRDLNFVKIFLPGEGYHMYTKEMTSSARCMLDYLLVVMDRQNMAIAPTGEIMERTKMSESSVCRGRQQLLELDYTRQRGHGIFMVNPSKACKADGDKRVELYEVYDNLKYGGKAK